MTLGKRLLIILSLFMGGGLLLFQYMMYDYAKAQAEEDLLNSAEHIHNTLLATRTVYQHQFVDSGLPLNEQTLGFLPAHTLNRISKAFAGLDLSGFTFNNVSDRPRNPEQQADAIELEAMAWFRANPNQERRFAPFTAPGGEAYLHYARPLWVEPYCLKCHGPREAAPPTIRAKYDTAYDYQVGDLRGILSIKIPSHKLQERVRQLFLAQLGWGVTLLLFLGGGITWVVRRYVIAPLGALNAGIDGMTNGHHACPVPSLPGEFDRVGRSFNAMSATLDARQQALRDAEQRFRMLLTTAADAIVVTDHTGRILLWNDAARRTFGYSAEEMRDQPVDRLIPEAFRRAHREGMARVNRGEPPKYIGRMTELHALHREGHIFPIEISLNSWEQRGERFHLAFLRDITERKEAEQTLRESEVKFHTMVDWTADWEYWIKPDRSLHYMTPSAEGIAGYRAEEFTQDPALLDQIVHPDDRELWARHIHHHLPDPANTATEQLEIRILDRGGETVWLHHTCRPVYDDADRYLGRRVTMRDISARKLDEERIRHLAYFDPLTKLPNRRLLADRLGQALIAGNRTQAFGALMMIDLDHFKVLNDTRGHDLGDRLLVEVAGRLLGGVRQEDTVARLGGDEFLVVAEGLGESEQTAANHAETIAEKIREAIGRPYTLGQAEKDYRTTPSIGVTLFRGQEQSSEALIKQADVALYQAKEAGRNTVRFFNGAMQRAIEAHIALEEAMRRGLANDEFRLYCQPQFDHEGRLLGAEALLRWQSPERGLVGPCEFIPLAEETGLILDLGRWVLHAACAQLKRWEAEPRTAGLKIAVNVSARQFHQEGFCAQVNEILGETGARPDRLKLELTESVVLKDVEVVIGRMERLHKIGVRFSLDDFGTGYSSLSYLKRLPIEQVKIDQSFVRDLTTNPNDVAVVAAILSMCRSLGIDAIAEGVESPAQRALLIENGCVAFQGYLFGRPIPVEEWPAMLAERELESG